MASSVWSTARSPEDEPDYALTDDDSSQGQSFPRAKHHPRFISLTEDCAGHRENVTGKNKFLGSGEVLAFEHPQRRHGHVLERGETDPVWSLLEKHQDIQDWEEDEVNAFSLPPGEMKTWFSRLVSVSVFQVYSQPELRHFKAAGPEAGMLWQILGVFAFSIPLTPASGW